MLTAISVARHCGMVGGKEPVILVSAHPPEGETPARIVWEYADMDLDSDEPSDTESTSGAVPEHEETDGVSTSQHLVIW